MRTRVLFVTLMIAGLAFPQDRKEKEETPRQVFERAAYVEEHERDFDKALKLYREAGSVAQFLGDQTLADEAMKAVKRVEARSGKGVDTAPSGDDLPLAVQRRLYLLVFQLCTQVPAEGNTKQYEAIDEILPFGEAAIPLLEKALNAETISDPEAPRTRINAEIADLRRQGFNDEFPRMKALIAQATAQPPAGSFRGDSSWAARSLARMDLPEMSALSDTPRTGPVVAAFLRAIKSPDPLVRNAVLREADPTRHRPVFDEALKDPNPAIVALAIAQLAGTRDPGLRDLMKRSVYRTDEAAPQAMEWLVRERLPDAIEAMKDEKLNPVVLRRGVETILRSDKLDQSKKIASLVDVAEPSSRAAGFLFEEFLTNRASPSRINWGALTPELRSRIEPLALKMLDTTSERRMTQSLLATLGDIGSLVSAEAIVKAMEGGRLSEEPSQMTAVICGAVFRAAPGQFPKAAELVRRATACLPERSLADLRISLYECLKGLAGRASVDDVIAGLNAVPQDQRPWYIGYVVRSAKTPSVPLSEAVMKVGEPGERAHVMSTIAGTRDKAFLPITVAALSDPEPNVREAASSAFRGLIWTDRDRAARLVIDAIDGAGQPSRELLNQLATLDPEKAIPLVRKLWESRPERRSDLYTIIANAGLNSEDANKFLVDNFDKAPPGQRKDAIEQFGRTLYQPAIDVIGRSLSDPSADVRAAAQETLDVFRKHREAMEEFKRWKTGDDEARTSISELQKLLESPSRDVVIGAVRSLGAVKAKAVLPALVKLLDRQDPELKKAVDEAIKKIGE